MIQRALRLLTTEITGMHRAAYILGASALASALLAFFRDRMLAYTFGASLPLDAYYAAFRIPDLLFVLLSSLVSVYVLVPELSTKSKSEQKTYLDTVLGWFSACVVIVAVFTAFLTPVLLPLLFPQLQAAGYLEELITLTRILLLQPVLLGLSNIFAAVTQSRNRYVLYAVAPLMYNIGIIIGIATLYPLFGLPGLAWGVVLGAFLHLGIQVPSVVRDGFFSSMPRTQRISTLSSTVAISVPRSLALSMTQISYLGLVALAASLRGGSVSVFMFAFNLQMAALAVIGASYSVAAFPKLAHMFSRGEREEFVSHVSAAARHIFFWSFPVAAIAIVLRAHIVRVILGAGAFDWTATRLTAASLALLMLSLVAQGILLLLTRGYYAAGRTLAPFLVSALVAALTLALGYGFVHVFDNQSILHFSETVLRVYDVPGSSVLSLSMAFSFACIVGALVLAIHFEHTFGGFFSLVRRAFFESLAAALVGGAIAYWTLWFLGDIGQVMTTLSVFARAMVAGFAGLLAGICVYALLENKEFSETRAAVMRRIPLSETPVVSAEDVA